MKSKSKTRLHFAVVFPSLDNTEKYDLLHDIQNFAFEHDIHLTAYFGTYESKNDQGFASRYEPCFDAIRRNVMFDGVIIYTGFIAHNVGTDKLIEYVNSISGSLPVVSIGLQIPGTYCIMSDNASGMYRAVDHLIKEDGKKKIAFIKGPDEHPEANQRLAGYLKALSDNGIAQDDSLILPGDFTPNGGRLAIEELIDVRKAGFDAVACSNDEAAMGAMRELKDRGYSLPRDAAFIGFDDVAEAIHIKPALSSVRQDFSKYCATAGETLIRILQGKKVDEVTYAVPELMIRRSCGCSKYKRQRSVQQDDARTFERIRRTVTDNLLLEFNLESLGILIHDSLPTIAIDFAIVGVYRSLITSTSGGEREVDIIFGFDGEHNLNVTKLHDAIYPFSDYSSVKGIDFDNVRRTLFFLPLFSGDEERGSALIAYNAFNPINWYESLRTNIAAAVKGANLIEQIQTLSVTDELTKLLNRRGFTQQVQTKLRYIQREPDYIPVVFAIDMDGLKNINDTYGHAEGDIAISALADILRDSVRMGDIIGRIGGDEFIIHSVVKTREDAYKLETRIREKFDEYNNQKIHPYIVSGSIGTSIQSEPTNEAFEKAMLEADNELYKEKQEKRRHGLSRN